MVGVCRGRLLGVKELSGTDAFASNVLLPEGGGIGNRASINGLDY